MSDTIHEVTVHPNDAVICPGYVGNFHQYKKIIIFISIGAIPFNLLLTFLISV
jgi:hypothetical protein